MSPRYSLPHMRVIWQGLGTYSTQISHPHKYSLAASGEFNSAIYI
jgi:hypothetical protein